ncbi:MAG: hypothetical protein U0263_18520 [Polyangiaceae bacterium]
MMRNACVLLACFWAGCSSSAEPPAQVETAKLDVDIRDSAELRIERRGSSIDVTLVPSRGFGVSGDGQKLRGKGTVERFPEADIELFTARFASTGSSDGPCGDGAVSLALALHRRNGQRRLSGSLTPYCGEGVWAGVPARNPLRLATTQPKEE